MCSAITTDPNTTDPNATDPSTTDFNTADPNPTDSNPTDSNITDSANQSFNSVFGPSLLLANTMSLAPKIDEIILSINELKPDLACFTETWLHDGISADCINIPGYNLINKNRTSGVHGGVCIYIQNSIKFKTLDHLHHPDFEVLWVHIRPKRLPRGVPCIVIGTLYHPPSADDNSMIDYLYLSLTTIEGYYPGCGIFLTGDFNRLDVHRLLPQFRMRQLVRVPTRGDQTLDLILTNLPHLYDKNSVETCPPFGLSDHNVVLLHPKNRPSVVSSRRTVSKRDTRRNRKNELGRYLSSCDWSILDSLTNCDEKVTLFTDLIRIGLDCIMPLQTFKLHINDQPWVTAEFKNLIKLRQRAFVKGDKDLFHLYRNRVNRERKSCRARFYSSKVQHLKETKPSQWWSDVKKIAGMTPTDGFDDFRSKLHLDQIDDLDPHEIANLINNAFLEPMLTYQPLQSPVPYDEELKPPTLSELEIYLSLKELNPRKAPGPDGLSNWLLKEFAEVLAEPVCTILNSSFREQKFPSAWKLANIIPLIKTKPVTNPSKDLRPISLTSVLSKVAEDFIVATYISPAVLSTIDPDQFGAIPKSCTTHALISMIHNWAEATDATGAAVRIMLLDYRKAFDLIDHNILAGKICNLPIPPGIARWVIDFLTDRQQRVKLANDCYSEWGHTRSGVPQGTKLGPWLFLLMINDLKFVTASKWKYVDDTSVAEIVKKGDCSTIQIEAERVQSWSRENKLQLNTEKCKEMIIDFKKQKDLFDPISVEGKEFDIVNHAKILGVTVSNNLLWNYHINDVIRKANKRLYFIVLLKRARLPEDDIILFYCTCIRPVLEYCAPVFHHSLSKYLSDDLERVQKRVLSILSPGNSYQHNMEKFQIPTLQSRRQDLCDNLFTKIICEKTHNLRNLLPPEHQPIYDFRHKRIFNVARSKTRRYQKTFIPMMCNLFNNS